MKIELDDIDKQAVIKAAIEQATARVLARLDGAQLASEIRNAVVQRVAQEVSGTVMKKAEVSQAIANALQSVERRVNKQVHETLARGFVVKLVDLPSATPQPKEVQ